MMVCGGLVGLVKQLHSIQPSRQNKIYLVSIDVWKSLGNPRKHRK
jgi:hypothetical protein